MSAAQQSVNTIFTHVRKMAASYTVDDAVEIVAIAMKEVYRRFAAGQSVSSGDLNAIVQKAIAAVAPVAAKIPGSERAAQRSAARTTRAPLAATLAAALGT